MRKVPNWISHMFMRCCSCRRAPIYYCSYIILCALTISLLTNNGQHIPNEYHNHSKQADSRAVIPPAVDPPTVTNPVAITTIRH